MLGDEGELEIREELPHGAPALGEDAGTDGGGGADGREDLDEDLIWQRAEVVHAHGGGVGRGLRALPVGDLLGAAGFHLHGAEQERWGTIWIIGSARAGRSRRPALLGSSRRHPAAGLLFYM